MEEWMCEKNKHIGKQTQLRCQKLCEDDPECVGISYQLKSFNCTLCTDDAMVTMDDDFGEFFKMPPGNAPSVNKKQVSLERTCKLYILVISQLKKLAINYILSSRLLP